MKIPGRTWLVVCGLLALQTGSAAEPGYSPYAEIDHPTRVYWGDTHLHTTNSLDARMLGVTLDVEQAYRFARGEQVVATHGQPARLARPLDFLVVSDHSDAMGAIDQLMRGNPELLKHEELLDMYNNLKAGGQAALEAFALLEPLLGGDYTGPLLDAELYRTVWQDYVATADRYNDPGRFTALIGYEWTPTNSGDKLHRNVLYRDGAETAGGMLPFTASESLNPQDLWKWMARYEAATGGKVLALAHNGNLSNGQMFPVETNPETGGAIDEDYVTARARWEPLYEVTQIKGDSEAHPFLSPDDGFADFETWDRGNVAIPTVPKTQDMMQYEYAREALKNGLRLEREFGTNPYRFGMVGSTDSHTALSTGEENNFFGKLSNSEPSAGRLADLTFPVAEGDEPWQTWEFGASGYAAVWAKENTREAIWDAMQRREVYATTGPRMTVRFFGGWAFSEEDASFQKLARRGYDAGVPMGGTLGPVGEAPTFLVGALKDPHSGHLDRVQIVKGWLDADGQTHEKVYNVAWSDAHKRGLDRHGKLPAVGTTVNVEEATWTNSIGDAELVGFWRDPEFDPAQPAFYYARVIEIPTPRWTAYDAKVFGVEPPEGARMVLQERAYTSPIWYAP